MSSRHPVPRGTPPTPTDVSNRARAQRQPSDLNRPLPPPPASSLPNSYDIPSLRQKQPDQSPASPSAAHRRSLSHPFPAVFGSRRLPKRNNDTTNVDDADSSDGGAVSKGPSSKSNNTQKNLNSPKPIQPTTGKCITCDSTVRWPQDLKTFRCTTCLTINDLEPVDALQLNDSSPTKPIPQKPTPISLDRTRRLIDQCLNDYFRTVVDRAIDRSTAANDEVALQIDEDDQARTDHFAGPAPLSDASLSPSRPRLQIRSPSDSILPASTFSRTSRPGAESLPHRPTRRPPDPPDQSSYQNTRRPSLVHGQETQHDVFRNLENYIGGAFSGCTALNLSFLSVKPIINVEEKRRPSVPARPPQAEPPATPSSEREAYVSELDAKTLLLGDVVENGLWWTGDHMKRGTSVTEKARERSPERWKGTVSARTPRINWLELAEWYHLVIHAGDDWRRRWSSLQPALSETKRQNTRSLSLDELHATILESQIHLQRTLLKATENLLKRPRRPVKNPEDCRFLLILWANPLLLTSTSKNRPRNLGAPKSHNDESNSPMSARKNSMPPVRTLSALGNHSGIIKRILGLLANLPNDTHLYLVSWFSRLSDGHFTKMVDMVSSFVTYRLTRRSEKPVQEAIDPTQGLIPSFSNAGARHASQLHAALDTRQTSTKSKADSGKPKLSSYGEDWQVRVAARVMALLFQANTGHAARRRDNPVSHEQRARSAGLNAKHHAHVHGQLIPISSFYNSMLDHADLVVDFEAWETTKTKFTFCQYPFFLSIWAKIHVLEYDAKRQMEAKAREAFFDTILTRKAVSQFLVLKVRRDCLVEDSLKGVSEIIGRGGNDVKKGLKIDFTGEDGVDAGGLRKEWFLLLVREIFDPQHGLFTYDEDSQYCYFNPYCFESSEQFFLVGVLMGLAIYNSTILDVALPPFVFRKMLASAPAISDKLTSTPKISHHFTLDDLAELHPTLARGLRQLLEFDGDVEEIFCRDFVVEVERYGEVLQIPLCSGGSQRSVTNANRREFVDLYVRYLLDGAVARQYEPFKRGFFTVCGGNALSLFQPEEIELLIRGSDEPLDVSSLRAVASYEGWPKPTPPDSQPLIQWFWDFFQQAAPDDQRKILSFITGSDRIPAMGATNLVIRLHKLTDREAEERGVPSERFPVARTCFNQLGLYLYKDRSTLEHKLWTAVTSSEGFGLK